ncbi:MAG TPA: lysylphosphatidylglycerol synthase transmembrane domain-containing protein [Gemmatimonadales bacterium]|nr:lysylphosphatidylglycerol synthase transmembrane domain-containing protein [Gemmatimonadales bacterium]
MPRLLTPRLLLRGFEISVAASLVGFGITLLYGNDLPAFLDALGHLHWIWILAGLGLASLDWIGGGVRLWVVARHVYPNPSLRGLILAGGMGAWAGYITPLNSGAGPTTMYTMRRYGVPLPVAVTSTFMSFVSTVLFFAIAGPLAVFFGAGRSLGQRGNVLGLSLYDLFLGSLTIIAGIGALMAFVLIFPRLARDLIHRAAEAIGRRSRRVTARLEKLRAGIDQAHESLVAFNSPRGWLSLFWATILSGPSHANKLLAGYVALRAVGIETNFVDILLVQTLVMFLLYFAPTPGASGIGEVLSAAVMSSYVPRELTPLYILVWRLTLTYFTIACGFLVFHSWVRRGLKGVDEAPVAGHQAGESAAEA